MVRAVEGSSKVDDAGSLQGQPVDAMWGRRVLGQHAARATFVASPVLQLLS